MEEQVNATTGVESANVEAPAAGEQTASEPGFDLEKLLFGDESEPTGADEGAADPAESKEQGEAEETQAMPDDASKAFAKKWAEESDKLEEKIRAKVMAETEEKTRNSTAAQADGAPSHRQITSGELEKLAEDLNTSVETANILYQQQMMIARLNEDQRKSSQMDRERSDYNSAVEYARGLKAKDSTMPDFNDKKLHDYRMKYYKQYGSNLPWKEAYKMQLADSVLAGDLTRNAQQEAIRQIQERDVSSVAPKGASTKQRSIADLPKEQFSEMVAAAKKGKYTSR